MGGQGSELKTVGAWRMAIDADIAVFEDRREAGDWRVEYFDDDGGCYVTVFAGPEAERRAQDYADTLMAGVLKLVTRAGSA
jgi:hypothetical protein